MSGHTPGPWVAEGQGINITIIFEGEIPGGRLAVCFLADGTQERRDANARLIATAPDLFDLAKQYASECGECAGAGITPDDQDCTECKFIRDVLAKAAP